MKGVQVELFYTHVCVYKHPYITLENVFVLLYECAVIKFSSCDFLINFSLYLAWQLHFFFLSFLY